MADLRVLSTRGSEASAVLVADAQHLGVAAAVGRRIRSGRLVLDAGHNSGRDSPCSRRFDLIGPSPLRACASGKHDPGFRHGGNGSHRAPHLQRHRSIRERKLAAASGAAYRALLYPRRDMPGARAAGQKQIVDTRRCQRNCPGWLRVVPAWRLRLSGHGIRASPADENFPAGAVRLLSSCVRLRTYAGRRRDAARFFR